jgi:hypothetical protein
LPRKLAKKAASPSPAWAYALGGLAGGDGLEPRRGGRTGQVLGTAAPPGLKQGWGLHSRG